MRSVLAALPLVLACLPMHAGSMQVRVSDEVRKPIAGFDYSDMPAFTGDKVAHEVKWGGKSLDDLKGKIIRLEFLLKGADLCTFRTGTAD